MQPIVYSHSDYFDVLDIFLKQWEMFKLSIPVIFSNKEYDGYPTIVYDESLSYSKRMIYCLQRIAADTILYQHEDMVLYDKPRLRLIEYLINNEYMDFLRLCRTGTLNMGNPIKKDIFNINGSKDFFAVQPTVWNRRKLIEFFEQAGDMTIWELEENGIEMSKKIGINGALYFENEPKRGGHYDSSIWPYVATAIVKGKWNFLEYPELVEILEKYNVDPKIRGIV